MLSTNKIAHQTVGIHIEEDNIIFRHLINDEMAWSSRNLISVSLIKLEILENLKPILSVSKSEYKYISTYTRIQEACKFFIMI